VSGTDEPDPLLPCPLWCAGSHGGQSTHLGDRFHQSRPVVLEVRTGLVEVEWETVIVQYPLSARPEKRDVYADAHMMAAVTMTRPADVVRFADMLTGYAVRLRELADELVIAQQQDRARVEADPKDAGREG
jgi:hypothetical protein